MKQSQWDDNLTTREREIAKRLARGRKPGRIAKSLTIQPQTVYNSLQNIATKLQLPSGNSRLVAEKLRSIGCCSRKNRERHKKQ